MGTSPPRGGQGRAEPSEGQVVFATSLYGVAGAYIVFCAHVYQHFPTRPPGSACLGALRRIRVPPVLAERRGARCSGCSPCSCFPCAPPRPAPRTGPFLSPPPHASPHPPGARLHALSMASGPPDWTAPVWRSQPDQTPPQMCPCAHCAQLCPGMAPVFPCPRCQNPDPKLGCICPANVTVCNPQP